MNLKRIPGLAILLALAALAWTQEPSPYGPIKIAPIKVAPIKGPAPMSQPGAKNAEEPAPRPAAPGKPRCDDCESLPKLMQELKEQEWLREKFWSYTRFSDYPYTAADVATLYCKVQCGMNVWMGKTPCPPGKCDGKAADKGESGASDDGAAPAMGTDPDTCQVVMYVKGKDGKRQKVPFNRAEKEKYECPAIVDYLLAHENSHVKTCKALKAKGQSGFYNNPEFVALDEVKAYEAGIRSLERAINALAQKCKEKGTKVNYRLPEDFKVSAQSLSAARDEVQRIAEELRKFQEQGRKP